MATNATPAKRGDSGRQTRYSTETMNVNRLHDWVNVAFRLTERNEYATMTTPRAYS